MLEDAEAEALIQKWSLDVKAFKNSRKGPSGRLEALAIEGLKIQSDRSIFSDLRSRL